MSDIDMVASIAAARHSRRECVTASTDSVDFLSPITEKDSVCFEAYVTWTGTSSMEIFVKIIAENLKTGDRRIAATAFLTFVALDSKGKTLSVPQVIPETKEEKKLFETGEQRAKERKKERNAVLKAKSLLTS